MFSYWPKTDFLCFILGFGNRSKKKERRYKESNLSRYLNNHFYRMLSCFPSCEQWKESNSRALLVHVERTLQNTTHLQSCFLPFQFVCVSLCTRMDLCVQIAISLSLHGTKFPEAIMT